jgi:hypothetical protein
LNVAGVIRQGWLGGSAFQPEEAIRELNVEREQESGETDAIMLYNLLGSQMKTEVW